MHCLALLCFAAAAPAARALLDARAVLRGHPGHRRLGATAYAQLQLTVYAGDTDKITVTIRGDTLVIGTRGDDDSGIWAGSAYVFRTSDGGATYGHVVKLTAADADSIDYFGSTVAVDGGTVVIGAEGDDSGTGAVYIFRTLDGGTTYDQVAKLTLADKTAGDYFGKSVAIDGDTVVVGASRMEGW